MRMSIWTSIVTDLVGGERLQLTSAFDAVDGSFTGT
jgi:hypothetical protein